MKCSVWEEEEESKERRKVISTCRPTERMTLLSITDADYVGTNYVIITLMLEFISWRLRSVTTTTTPRKIESIRRTLVPNRNDTLRLRNSRTEQTSTTSFPSYKFLTVSQFPTELEKRHEVTQSRV